MRIALLGTRGIPANYGGFETFAEELSTRLALIGHSVAVYCRERPEESPWRGVELRYLPTIRHKYFDTLAHTFLSTLHLLFHRCDVALYCNAANAIFTILPRLAGMPVALNVDGIERKRKKWNRLAKAWYLVSERLATFLPNEVVTDAQAIAGYYRGALRQEDEFYSIWRRRRKNRNPRCAARARPGARPLLPLREPNGTRESRARSASGVRTSAHGYETGPVGDAPYAADYIRQVRNTQDPRIVIPGAIYGRGYRELGSHCFAYIHSTTVGGTHPALIEAMGRGALVLYRDTPENREVAEGAGIPFAEHDLAQKIEKALAMKEEERNELRRHAVERVAQRYSWDAVTADYHRLFQKLAPRRIVRASRRVGVDN